MASGQVGYHCYHSLHTSYLSRTPQIYSCKFFLAGVNFFRFNAKIWQFTVYFAVITQKIGNFLCILLLFTRFFGVNFILQKFCSCKKMTNMRYATKINNYLALKIPVLMPFPIFELLCQVLQLLPELILLNHKLTTKSFHRSILWVISIDHLTW